jgi:small subunit ribosomal protein S16
MLAIRMRRVGSKKRPFFRLVVARSEAARDGSFLEILGSYYPRAKPAKVEVDRERVDYWVSKGARPSHTVRTLIARHVSPAAPATDVAAAAAPAPPVPRPAAPVAEPAPAVQADAAPALEAEAAPAPAPAPGD